MEIDPVILRTCQAAVSLVFGAAALAKLVNIERFKRAVAAYALLPPFLVAPVAFSLGIAELAIALALLVESSRHVAALGGLVLLGVFFVAIGVSLARGNRDIDCGCWAVGRNVAGQAARLSGWHLGRVALLALMVVPGMFDPARRAVEWLDYVTAAGGLAIAGGLFVAIDLLLANDAAAQKLRS